MNAIELNAVAHDGKVCVTIPDVYRQAWDEKPVRVIVIVDEEAAPPQHKASLLTRLQEITISGPADFSENIDAAPHSWRPAAHDLRPPSAASD